jgi:hypothetical protein
MHIFTFKNLAPTKYVRFFEPRYKEFILMTLD